MRKLLITILSLTSLIGIKAQYDPEALATLDAMSAKYKNMGAFKASFSQKLTNKSAGVDEVISGKITVKENMYLLEVAGQRIFNNGTYVYTYSPENREVTISNYDPEESEIMLGNVYDIYKEGFKYVLTSKEANGDRLIDLDPKSRDKSYFKIKMVINSKDELKSFTIFERTGNQYLYSINAFEAISLNNKYFTFDPSKYPGVEIIDFR